MSATRTSLREDLRRLGVSPGDLLMVHSSVRSVGPVVGGVNVIVHSLLDAVGPEGTLVAYLDFEPFYDPDADEEVPVFDPRIAQASRLNGILPETLRKWPGAFRSGHPDAGVAAVGARAAWITGEHPFRFGYGEGSPLERVVEGHGKVLMLGAPLDTITLLHYAEHKARIPDKRMVRYRRLMPSSSGPQWVEFEEFDTSEPVNEQLPENCFEQIALAHLAAGYGTCAKVGAATSFLFDARELVRFAIRWLEEFFASTPGEGPAAV